MSSNSQLRNTFDSRVYMKYNSSLTVPTFSVLHGNGTTISASNRSSNIEFEDAPEMFLFTNSNKFGDNVSAGISYFNQTVGVFSNNGFIFNYAQDLSINRKLSFAFGLNLSYNTRSANNFKVLSDQDEPLLQNYQGVSVINFQPAVTFTYNSFQAGVLVEDLIDYNFTSSEMISEFTQKTFSGHLAYSTKFDGNLSFLDNSLFRVLGLFKKTPNGYSYGGNMLLDIAQMGWLEFGYDKVSGIIGGLGINVSPSISLAFSYQNSDFASSTELGVFYTYDKKKLKKKNRKKVYAHKEADLKSPKGKASKVLTNSKVKDSINRLRNEIERLNKAIVDKELIKEVIVRDTVYVTKEIQKEVIKQVESPVKVTENTGKDTSLKRRTDTPWRKPYKEVNSGGGSGGTAYFVAIDQFKDLSKTKEKIKQFENRKVDVKYVKDPNSQLYYIYIDKFSKPEDADRVRMEINGGAKGFENNVKNDLGLKIKSISKDPVYVVKINFGSRGTSYREPKKQGSARVFKNRVSGVSSAYYLRVSVNGKKAYADKFVDELRADGFDADYYVDPSTGFRHVYIFKTNNKEEIISKYKSNMDGTYYDKKSIIFIE